MSTIYITKLVSWKEATDGWQSGTRNILAPSASDEQCRSRVLGTLVVLGRKIAHGVEGYLKIIQRDPKSQVIESRCAFEVRQQKLAYWERLRNAIRLAIIDAPNVYRPFRSPSVVYQH